MNVVVKNNPNLSDEQLERLMKISRRNKVAENIVEAALNTDSVIPKKYSYDNIYVQEVKGGKDNTTAVYYDNSEFEEELPRYKHR